MKHNSCYPRVISLAVSLVLMQGQPGLWAYVAIQDSGNMSLSRSNFGVVTGGSQESISNSLTEVNGDPLDYGDNYPTNESMSDIIYDFEATGAGVNGYAKISGSGQTVSWSGVYGPGLYDYDYGPASASTVVTLNHIQYGVLGGNDVTQTTQANGQIYSTTDPNSSVSSWVLAGPMMPPQDPLVLSKYNLTTLTLDFEPDRYYPGSYGPFGQEGVIGYTLSNDESQMIGGSMDSTLNVSGAIKVINNDDGTTWNVQASLNENKDIYNNNDGKPTIGTSYETTIAEDTSDPWLPDEFSDDLSAGGGTGNDPRSVTATTTPESNYAGKFQASMSSENGCGGQVACVQTYDNTVSLDLYMNLYINVLGLQTLYVPPALPNA